MRFLNLGPDVAAPAPFDLVRSGHAGLTPVSLFAKNCKYIGEYRKRVAGPELPTEIYHPRLIGLAPPLESVRSGSVYEFLAVGRDEVGTLAKLNGVLNSHHLKLTTAGGYSVPEPGTFVWSGFADYSRSEFKPEDTLREMRKLSFVTYAEAAKIDEVVFDRYLFPVTMLGKQRAIIFRAEPFTRVEQRLIAAFGSGGATIMFDEGRHYALEAFSHYVAMLPGASPEVILKNAVAGLRATGWGLFAVDVSRLLLDGVAKVTVRDPPFAGVPGARESFFTNGIACGALEGIFSAKTAVESSSYDEKTRTLHLVLKAIR